MRVVQLLTQEVGGPVDHAVDVAVGLAQRGIDSHVIGPESAGSPRSRAAGVTWHPLAMRDKTDWRGGLAMAGRLRDLAPDVVHLQDRRAGWLGRALGHHLGGVAVVYTLHGVADGLSDLVPGNALAAPRRRRDRLYYLTGERAITRWGGARVVVPSGAVARFATEHIGLDPEIVDVVPNGVDVHRFQPRPSTQEPPPTALWLGVLAEVKRIGVLLDAAEDVADLRLIVVGDGPLRDDVVRRIGGAALAGRVELRGRVADPTPIFADADLFALTSAAENCPLAMLQAMAAGLPVVSTAVGGIPEVVRDGVDGLLVGVDEPAALHDALLRLCDDQTLRARMGASARERILDRYTIEQCVDELLAVYRRAGSRAGHRAGA